MFYFAAASYSEMARRLGKADLSTRFLLRNRPEFASAFDRACDAARNGQPLAQSAVRSAVEPFNIAGLCDPAKRGWYGVDLEDVVRGAEKLQSTPHEVRGFFQRMGWA